MVSVMKTLAKSIVEIDLKSGETRDAVKLTQNDDRDASLPFKRLPLTSLQLNLARWDGVWRAIYCSKEPGFCLPNRQANNCFSIILILEDNNGRAGG